MDPGVAFSAAAVATAAIIGAIAGGRRGVLMMTTRADAELQRLVAAQSQRIALLEKHLAESETRVATLEQKVQQLEERLAVEQAITARITRRAPRQPKAST